MSQRDTDELMAYARSELKKRDGEIDRLTRDLASSRAEAASLRKHNTGLVLIEAQKDAEIEKLRADRATYDAWATEIKGGIEDMRADNERLRKALAEIAAMRGEDLPLADGQPEDNLAALHARITLEQ